MSAAQFVMQTQSIVYYFVVVNLLSAMLFAYDKFAAKGQKNRVPELRLHLLELFGGVFATFGLMYLLRHKNRKFAYWSWTWAIMLVWVLGFLIIFNGLFAWFIGV